MPVNVVLAVRAAVELGVELHEGRKVLALEAQLPVRVVLDDRDAGSGRALDEAPAAREAQRDPAGFWKFGSAYTNFGPARSCSSSASTSIPSSSIGTGR